MFYEIVLPKNVSVMEAGVFVGNIKKAVNDLLKDAPLDFKIVNTLDCQPGESGISVRITKTK